MRFRCLARCYLVVQRCRKAEYLKSRQHTGVALMRVLENNPIPTALRNLLEGRVAMFIHKGNEGAMDSDNHAGAPHISLLLCALLLLALFLSTPTVRAQLYSGTVTGVVTDPTGAVVPNANVTLADQNKGYQFTAMTDSAGRYLFRSVAPGAYRLRVEAKGFQSQEQSGVS